jgi:hypothetical protein
MLGVALKHWVHQLLGSSGNLAKAWFVSRVGCGTFKLHFFFLQTSSGTASWLSLRYHRFHVNLSGHLIPIRSQKCTT